MKNFDAMTPRILLVEDDATNALLLRRQLETLGYSLERHVTTGEDAIQAVGLAEPDLIFMDIHLGSDLSGIETVRTIRKSSQARIIFLTAHGTEQIRKAAMDLQPLLFLERPIPLATLRSAMDTFHRSFE